MFLCLRHYMVLWTWDSDLHQRSCLAFLLLPSLAILGLSWNSSFLVNFFTGSISLELNFAELISSSAASVEACIGSLSNSGDFVENPSNYKLEQDPGQNSGLIIDAVVVRLQQEVLQLPRQCT
ncbi:hypothetical protein Tco_1486891 [Tanacetum coccineum]